MKGELLIWLTYFSKFRPNKFQGTCIFISFCDFCISVLVTCKNSPRLTIGVSSVRRGRIKRYITHRTALYIKHESLLQSNSRYHKGKKMLWRKSLSSVFIPVCKGLFFLMCIFRDWHAFVDTTPASNEAQISLYKWHYLFGYVLNTEVLF